jgi:hypothetical protein
MTTPFAARDTRLSRSIEKAFGEQFTFSAVMTPPNGDVNLPKVADPSKPSFTVVGVWEAIADKNWPAARGSNPDDDAMRRAVQDPSVSVDAALFQGHWVPFAKCRCTRLFDGAVYEIAKALPDDMGRVLFFLSSRMKP